MTVRKTSGVVAICIVKYKSDWVVVTSEIDCNIKRCVCALSAKCKKKAL